MKIESLKEKARTHEQKEEWEKALDQYLQAIRQLEQEEEQDISLFNRVGDLEVRLGKVDRAVEHYERAVDLYVESELPNNAIAICKKVIRNLPERYSIYLKMGQIRAHQGFLTDARQNFLTYAEQKQEEGDLEEAFRALIEFVELAPEDIEIRLALASQLAQHDRVEEAVEQFQEARRRLILDDRADEAEEVAGRIRDLDPAAEIADPEAVRAAGEEALTQATPSADEDDWSSSFSDFALDDEEEDQEAEAEPAAEVGADLGGISGGGAGGADEEEEEAEVGGLEGFDIDAEEEEEEAEEEFGAELEEFSDFGAAEEEEEEADELPTMDFGEEEEEEEEEAEPLPTMGFDDEEDEPLSTVDSGEEADEEPDVDEEAEAEPLPTMDSARKDEAEEPVEAEPSPAEETAEEALEEAASEARMEAEAEEEEEAPAAADEAEPGTEDWLSEVEAPEEETAGAEEPEGPAEPAPGERGPEDLREEGERLLSGGDDQGLELLDRAHEEFADRGRIEDAIAVVDRLAQERPEDVSLRQRRVEYAYRAHDDEILADAYLDLGAVLRRTGQRKKARSAYQQVLDTDPENAEAREALADLSGEAEAEAEPAARSEVASSEEYVDLGSMILDEEEEEKSTRFVVPAEAPSGDQEADFSRMLDQFKEKVSENVSTDDVSAHYDLGTAYKEMGLVDEGISEFQAALRADRTHLPTYEMLGQCFLEKDQPEAAVRTLRKALDAPYEVEDELLGIYYFLGRAHEELGQTEEAVDYYDKVFALDINFMDVTERLRTLR